MSVAPTKTTQTLVIKPGETKVLPKGAVVTSVIKDGAVLAESNCPAVQDALDLAEQFKCYSFFFATDATSKNIAHPFDPNSAWINKMVLAGIDYPIDLAIHQTDDYGFESTLQTKFPEALCKIVDGLKINHFDNRHEYELKVKMAPSIAKAAQLHVTGTGFYAGAYISPVEQECPVSE